ncbi:MAG: hypothetical protein ACT6RD_11130 [Brevundimonas sp.]|uniref:hypothetical protein n=1 Tax=Brevundimonas sp. TaxID=1871086 RepID=UPI00403411B9
MTLFGTTLDGAAIASLCGLLATLFLWVFALRGERSRIRWFRDWEAQRKARRDAEIEAEQASRPKTGPWG